MEKGCFGNKLKTNNEKAAYFIGIMKCFEKNVKIIGAIRQSDYMN